MVSVLAVVVDSELGIGGLLLAVVVDSELGIGGL